MINNSMLFLVIILICEVMSMIDKRVINNQNDEKQEETVQTVMVVAGGTAKLPCEINIDNPEDRAKLVLWFRNQSLTPFYTYNVMNANQQPKHWRDPESPFSSRTKYRPDPPKSVLTIDNSKLSDGGRYKCRVDYHLEQTSFQLIDLIVIMPPEKPRIFYRTEPIESKRIHVNENQSLSLICESKGGFPLPTLTWWKDSNLIDKSFETYKNKVVNKMEIDHVGRENLNTMFICQASNNNISVPVLATVKLDLSFPPLSVQILRTNHPLIAGQSRTLECEVTGARPKPKITWWKGATQLREMESRTSLDENTTVSSINFVPEISDRGATLLCRVETPGLQEIKLSEWKLPVQYSPRSQIKLGGSLNHTNIREYDDVYFECRVNSNPIYRRITWKHNERILYQDKSDGIIISGNSLAIQGIKRDFIGNYTCSATNDIGRGEDSSLSLDIKYTPACAPGQQMVYEVAKLSSIHVSCSLNANPASELSFKWKFNTTANTVNIPESDISNAGTTSIAKYTPRTELDFGTLICWGSNSVGRGSPCVFHLLPIGPPDPPANCIASNVTYSTLKVSCEGKYDKPLPDFFLEVRLAKTGRSVLKLQNDLMDFDIIGLRPGSTYSITVKAKNKFGTSEPVYVSVVTLLEPTKQLAETKVKENKEEETRILAIILGGVALVILLVIAILLIAFTYRRRLLERNSPLSHGTNLIDSNKGPDLLLDSGQYECTASKSIPSSPFNAYQEILPTISCDVFGKNYSEMSYLDKGRSTLCRPQIHHINSIQAGSRSSFSNSQAESESSPNRWNKEHSSSEDSHTRLLGNSIDYSKPGTDHGFISKDMFAATSVETRLIKCPGEVVMSKESRI